MADFCKDCALEMWGERLPNDLEALCLPGFFTTVICEGCGIINVDYTGKCVTHTQPEHKALWERPTNDPPSR